MKVSFVLNGRSVSCEAEADEVLVDTLRNTFCLTGTKKACGTGAVSYTHLTLPTILRV